MCFFNTRKFKASVRPSGWYGNATQQQQPMLFKQFSLPTRWILFSTLIKKYSHKLSLNLSFNNFWLSTNLHQWEPNWALLYSKNDDILKCGSHSTENRFYMRNFENLLSFYIISYASISLIYHLSLKFGWKTQSHTHTLTHSPPFAHSHYTHDLYN